MSTERTSLLLALASPVQQVSLLSSLLRTLQAAVRDAAQGTEQGKKLFAGQRQPILTVTAASDGGQLTLSFAFSGEAKPDELDELGRATFRVFMSEAGLMLKAGPQRTLWGTPARPIAKASAENERMTLFLADLVRLGDVTLTRGGQAIAISDGKVEASGF